MRIAAPLFALSLTVALSAVPAHSKSAQSDSNTKVIELSAKKYEFNPTEIRVPKGTKVELHVHSVDETHGAKLEIYPEGAKKSGAPGLVFDHPEENGKVSKDADQVLKFTAQEPGTYDFKCAKLCGFGHGRMKGKLIVEP
ncbi:MAG TPA: cupredoxin domain-containing protein [Candidatus Acidoferrum sp.]|jgi:cytochrome c oxidase subunit 2